MESARPDVSMIEVELYGGPSDGMKCEIAEEICPYELITYQPRGFGQKDWEAHYQRVNERKYEYRGQT
jgi:ferredoxin